MVLLITLQLQSILYRILNGLARQTLSGNARLQQVYNDMRANYRGCVTDN